MARSPFSLIRAMCAYRAEACFIAAFVFMLLHETVGHRRIVIHTNTAGIVRHEISRHDHTRHEHTRHKRVVERSSARAVVRTHPAPPTRVAAPPRTVHVTPRRTVEKVRNERVRVLVPGSAAISF